MSIQRAEELKKQWTDKYVMVQKGAPELRRFEGRMGCVKTVNMNCRLLIQFDTPADISWYDIAPEFLRVVDRPDTGVKSDDGAAKGHRPSTRAAGIVGDVSPIDQVRAQADIDPNDRSVTDSRFEQIRKQAKSAQSASESMSAAVSAEQTSVASGDFENGEDETSTKVLFVSENEFNAEVSSNSATPQTLFDTSQQPTNLGGTTDSASRDGDVAGDEDPVNMTFRGKKLPKKDDLKIVEGIGPKISDLFNADGIVTWVQLSEADPARLRRILHDAGPRFKMHNPETWPAQAKLAATGSWQQLEEYQDHLDGGREPGKH